VQGAKAQQKVTMFTSDSVKFLADLDNYMQTGLATHKDVKDFLEKFTSVWKTPAYSHYYKLATYDIANDMLARKLPVYPMFQSFLNSMMNFVNSGLTKDQFDQWHACLSKLMKQKPTTNCGLYLSMSENLFGSNVLFKSPTLSWSSSSSNFTFNCDSTPTLVFKQINLKCTNERNDTIVIYKTDGVFSILKGTWVGKGGKVDWVRTGLDVNAVYGELSNYNIVFKQGGFVADSVTFWNKNYFDKPLQGKVLERDISEPQGKETYPRFSSYGKRFDIPNLTPDVTYEGGFSMKGRRFVGSGTTEEPARLIFKKDNKPFFVASSTDYSITKDQIMADDAKIVIHMDTDSISHPDIQMVYNIPKKHISLIRTDQGLSQTPFFDSYHKVNLFFEELSWYLDQPKMQLHNLEGSAQNIADFESQDFFRPEVYEAFNSANGTNSITQMAQFAKTINSRDFKMDDLATFMHLASDEVRPTVMKLATVGLVNYDVINDEIHVQDKLFRYITNQGRKTDYDVIDFHSENPGRGVDNGTLDLLTYDITLNGIKVVVLSDSQNVYVYPKDQQMLLHRNRVVDFAGNVHAGRFDFYGQHFRFKYTEFLIKMNNTDSISVLAESFDADAQGRHHLVRVKSVIQHVSGELDIDRPTNKSGIIPSHNFPKLKSDTNSFVYYDKKSIQGGVYKKDRFYFEVNPFEIDSLGSFTNAGLHFAGTFASAGITPDMPEVLRLQPDYSLGFVHDAPPEGLTMYGGKGKFFNKMQLSNKGLKGTGTINYVTSISKSDDFTFFPDSTNAVASSFDVQEQKTAPEFPQVHGDTVKMHWVPKEDYMDVADVKTPFSCYNKMSTFHGHMTLSPTILTGGGEVDFLKANLISKLIRFKQHKFLADTADFNLKGEDLGGIAFGTHNMNSEVDFEKKMGEFKSNGNGSVVKFPENEYIAFMDEFKWYMDKDDIELSSSQKQSETSDAKELQFSGSRFISVDPKQDSLQFIAPSARFSLKNLLITAKNVPFINVADARIIPDSGRVIVHKNAFMEPLNRAKITANTVTKYYKLYNADVTITSRKNYSGSGYYDYIDETKNKRPIYFSNIHVDTTHQTVANTTIADTAHFAFSPNFKFQGDVKLVASNPFLFFDGETRIAHQCNEIKIASVKFASQVDPNNIQIPISANPVNENSVPLAASPVLSGNVDSTYIYGAFLSPIINGKKDHVMLIDSGYLAYDKASGQYRISNKEKLVEQSLPGNYTSLDTRRCILYSEGRLNLGMDYGALDMQTLGSATDYLVPDSLNSKISMLLNFFFDDGALGKMAADFTNMTNLKPFDYSKPEYQKNLRELLGKDQAEKLISQLTLYGVMKKIPKELEATVFLSQVNLKWNSSTRSYTSVGPIGVGNIGKTSINKMVDGHIELRKKRGRDELNIYLELDPMHWYYFTYASGQLQTVASNGDYNSIISGLKPDKRETKNDKGKFSFAPAQTTQKTIFLRRVAGSSDDNNN
jgi:hypothetical protein